MFWLLWTQFLLQVAAGMKLDLLVVTTQGMEIPSRDFGLVDSSKAPDNNDFGYKVAEMGFDWYVVTPRLGNNEKKSYSMHDMQGKA